MAQTYATLKDDIEAKLQDASNAVFSATVDLDPIIKNSLREVSRYVPYRALETFQVESRTGTATSTSTDNLVDATNAQFLSTDVGKVVYNSTDKTWAVILTYSSTTTVGISKDIFASGENYSIYNRGCKATNQVYIGDITDYLWVTKVEYPVGTRREVDSIDGDILTFGLDVAPDDTALSDADKDVHVYFAKKHKVSQLTDLAGAVNNAGGYAAGSVSMAINGLQSSGTIEAGQEFTLASTRGTYTVTADATIGTNAATITFFPGLENAVEHAEVITFKLSTLTPFLESAFCKYAAAEAAISKASQPIQSTVNAIAVLTTVTTAIGAMTARIEAASKASTGDIALGRAEMAKAVALITTSAAAEIALINPEIDQALADLDSGRLLISTNTWGDEAMKYANYAAHDVNNGRGYLTVAEGYIKQAQADEQLASVYMASASHELSAASQYLNQAVGYLRQINSYLSVGGSWRNYQEWGERMKADALRELKSMARPPRHEILPRT